MYDPPMNGMRLVLSSIAIGIGLAAGCAHAGQDPSGDAGLTQAASAVPKAPNMVLVYYGFDSAGARDWTSEQLQYYLASYQREEGKPVRPEAPLFDTVLWMYRRSSRKHMFESSPNYLPTTETDWRECMARLFLPGLQLDALNTAAARLSKELNKPMTVDVILTLPHPDVRVTDWSEGRGGSHAWNFHSSDEARLDALRWYAETIIQRWNEARFEHLRLLGFYWFHESHTNARSREEFPDDSSRNDVPLMQATARMVHGLVVQGRPLTLSWIPYHPYGLNRMDVSRSLIAAPPKERVDYLMIQPNYFFARGKKPKSELETVCRNAASIGAGIEVEFDETLYDDPAQRQRLLDYLEAIAAVYPDRSGVPTGYYQGIRAWYEMATRPELEPWYDKVCEFVQGGR